MKYLVLLLLLPCTALAQSVSVSPTSFYGFGKIMYTSSVSAEYKDIGVHYFYVRDEIRYTSENKDGNRFFVGESQSTLALSYTPVNIKNIVNAGMIFSPKRFPTSLASRLNFYVDLGVSFNKFRVSYTHISNGFGVTNKYNPGIDSIKLTFRL